MACILHRGDPILSIKSITMKWLMLLTLMSCSSVEALKPDVRPFVFMWNSLFSIKTTGLKIGVRQILRPTIGTCDPIKGVIWIDKTAFSSASEAENTIFHEIYHCLCDTDHDVEMIDLGGDEIPKSLMFNVVMDPDVYSKYRQYYILEMKDKVNSCKGD